MLKNYISFKKTFGKDTKNLCERKFLKKEAIL